MSPLLPAAVDLAVRAAITTVNCHTQQYSRRERNLLWDPQRLPKRLYKRRGNHWFIWHNSGHPFCPTGHLYFFGDVWGVAFERWWRLADLRREPRHRWVGQARSIERALGQLVQAMGEEVERLRGEYSCFAAWEVECKIADAAGLLLTCQPPRRKGDDGFFHTSLPDLLRSVGVQDTREWNEPLASR